MSACGYLPSKPGCTASHPLLRLSYLYNFTLSPTLCTSRKFYRGADKSLARPGRKQARKHVRDARDFNNIETLTVMFLFLRGKASKEIHTILTETLACFLPGQAKDLSAPLCCITVTTIIISYMFRHSQSHHQEGKEMYKIFVYIIIRQCSSRVCQQY